jgi:hypothetical protein
MLHMPLPDGLTVRIDTAVSNENWGVQMMIGHPFQF